MSNIKPVRNGILVELLKQQKETVSGIILTTKDETQQAKGKIVALGEGVGEDKDFIKTLKTDMVVLFGRYAGEEIASEVGSESTFKIIQASDVIAIVE